MCVYAITTITIYIKPLFIWLKSVIYINNKTITTITRTKTMVINY